jgi:uncharacterized protein (DUF885 family)
MQNQISRRTALMSGAAITALAACGEKPAAPAANADDAFKALGTKWLDGYIKTRPVAATALGDHRYDDQIDDISETGRAAKLALIKETRAALSAIDRTKLSRDNQVDAAMLTDQLDGEEFGINELQSYAWDPLTHNDVAGGALYSLVAREFAPLPERLLHAAARMEKLPALLAESRKQLDPARVPLIHATTYQGQNAGNISTIDEMILSQSKALGPNDQMRLMTAADAAKAAITEHGKWIEETLIPNAKGNFRVGALYDKKLKFSTDYAGTKEDLLAKAKADLDRVTTEMYEIALGQLGSAGKKYPAKPTPAQRREAVAAAINIAASQAPPPEKLFESAKATLDDCTNFVREKQIVTLPDAPVKVIEMPKFQQGVSIAYCDSPGPLDNKLDTFYAISPIPADWTKQQITSFLREYNSRSINELTIHEAMPGHYVQIWHSNKHPSILRAVLGSGSFIEGWAVYAQDVMIAAGHGGNDPLRKLVNLKWALRVISNTIIDHDIHVAGLEEKPFMDFLVNETFQEEREAALKWNRARVSSGQLASYYVGWQEHLGMRKDWEAKEGAAFNLMKYHDLALSHGSPPGRFVRQLLFNEPIA